MSLNIGILSSSYKASGGGVDADAQAFFNRVTAAGGTLTTTEKNAVNTMTLSFKSLGIWSKMRVIYPMVGASSAACRQNLKSSSFTATFGVNETFSSNGVLYANEGILVSLNLNSMNSINDISFGYYCRNDLGSTGSFGWGYPTSTSPICEFFIEYTNGIKYGYLFDNANDGGIAGDSKGLNSISRIATNIKYIQKNSTITTFVSASSGSLSSKNFYFGRGSQGAETSRQNAFSFIGDGLTSVELVNLYTSVQAFQTTLGRQV